MCVPVGYLSQKRINSFWSKVTISSNDECWTWKGRIKNGNMNYGTLGKDSAHRISWILHNGNTSIPDGLLVCHKCDNPPCVNPSHLFLGTMLENIMDMVTKGRNKSKPKIDISGQKFGMLTAIKRTVNPRTGYRNFWECLCECGNTKFLSTGMLLGKKQSSCGCRKSNWVASNWIRNKV